MAFDVNALGELQAEFKRVTTELQNKAQSAIDESARLGGMQAETKVEVDKVLAQQGELKASIDELMASQRELTQRVSARRGGGDEPRRSLGDLVSAHADIAAFAKRGATGTMQVSVQNAITSLTGSAGALISSQRDPDIVSMPRRRMTVKDLITVGETASNSITYAKQTARTGAAGIVADDGLTMKPEIGLAWASADALVRTIAAWIPIHKHTLDDVPALRTEIDTELTYAIDLAEEAQILAGDGTNQNLSGLITNASAYAQTAREPAGATPLDRLRLAMLQVSLAGYVVDGHVLNSIDWALMEILKDAENRYIFGDPTQSATARLWGRPVVDTIAIPEDKFLTGAFKLAATYYQRQDIEILVSSEDRDNFVKNMLTIRAEKRAALAVKRPLAMVYGDFGRVA